MVKLITKLIAFLIFVNVCLNASNNNLEEKLRKSILLNNPNKVEKYINRNANINFIYVDETTPFYLALKNLGEKASKTPRERNIAASITGFIAVVGIDYLLKKNNPQMSNFKKWYNSKLYEKIIAPTDPTIQDRLDSLYEKLYKLVPENPEESYEKTNIENEIKLLEKQQTSFIKAYKRQKALRSVLPVVGILSSIIVLIFGTMLILNSKKRIKEDLASAQKIVFLIKDNPKFKQDLRSLELIEKKIVMYSKFLKRNKK